MEYASLTAVADEALAEARAASAHRAAHTLYGGHQHALRLTVIALLGGNALSEHESPGEATLQVLQGRVRVTAGDDLWSGAVGDLLSIPPVRHDLFAVEDSVILLTVVKPR